MVIHADDLKDRCEKSHENCIKNVMHNLESSIDNYLLRTGKNCTKYAFQLTGVVFPYMINKDDIINAVIKTYEAAGWKVTKRTCHGQYDEPYEELHFKPKRKSKNS